MFCSMGVDSVNQELPVGLDGCYNLFSPGEKSVEYGSTRLKN